MWKTCSFGVSLIIVITINVIIPKYTRFHILVKVSFLGNMSLSITEVNHLCTY